MVGLHRVERMIDAIRREGTVLRTMAMKVPEVLKRLETPSRAEEGLALFKLMPLLEKDWSGRGKAL